MSGPNPRMSVYTRAYDERDGSAFEVYENLTVEYRDKSHRYWLHCNGERTPAVSVTSALKVLDRPALLHWAENCGAEGAARLAAMGELEHVPFEDAGERVRLHKLGMEAKRDAGADRGTAVHQVLEFWAREHAVPDLSQFPGDVRGYVQGLCAWLLVANPKPTGVERFVGSVKHNYAGRMDLRADLDGRDCIVDLKTSKNARAYPEGHAQARAYSMAAVECGEPEPEGVVIVAVGEDGDWVQVECEATDEDWLAILGCYRAMNRLRGSIKTAEKAAA